MPNWLSASKASYGNYHTDNAQNWFLNLTPVILLLSEITILLKMSSVLKI
jgi:hypothetical protein